MRKFFIIYVARELRLIFPTPAATAMTIRSMHGAVSGEAIAKMKMKALSIAFSAAFILRIVSQYCLGILWDWHIFTWFYIWGNYNNAALNVENWGWLVEWTPAFIGSGMLVGLNASISFFAGSVIAWGIIGPTLVNYGEAFGYAYYSQADVKAGAITQDFFDKWGGDNGQFTFWSLGPDWVTKDTPSPRFWLLWPGVLMMIAVSFTELAIQYKVVAHISRAIYRGSCAFAADMSRKAGRPNPALEEKGRQTEGALVEDPAEDHELVKWWMWLPLLIIGESAERR